jgi:hypothetical protein
MTALFDQPPVQYRRDPKAKGWLTPAPNPHAGSVKKLATENVVLKSQLDAQVAMLTELAAKVEELVAKKGKK